MRKFVSVVQKFKLSTMIKLLAFSDLHLGRSSTGLTGAPQGLSTEEGWRRIVDLAIEQHVDAVLLGGDCIDRDNVFFESVSRLSDGFKRLSDAGIEVFMVGGNHDYRALPEAIRSAGKPNIRLLGAKGKWEAIDCTYNGHDITFVGWSFPDKHFRTSPMAGFDTLEVKGDRPVIGLVHADIAPESPYAPVTEPELFATPVDYWLLGHIHKPQTFSSGGKRADYPGSPQALSPKETGEHGVLLIEVASKFDIHVQHIPLSPVRYEQHTVNLTGVDADQIRSAVMNQITDAPESHDLLHGHLKALVFDVRIEGQQADFEAVKNQLNGLTDDWETTVQGVNVSVRKITYALEPMIENLDSLARQNSPAGTLAQLILALEGDDENATLADRVLERFDQRFEDLARHALFNGLRNRGREVAYFDEQRAMKKQRVADECRRLLSELLNQVNVTKA